MLLVLMYCGSSNNYLACVFMHEVIVCSAASFGHLTGDDMRSSRGHDRVVNVDEVNQSAGWHVEHSEPVID